MGAVRLKFLLAIILVLAGVTLFVGINLEDNIDVVLMPSHTPSSLVNQRKIASERPAPNSPSFRPDSEVISRSARVSVDLIPILRC